MDRTIDLAEVLDRQRLGRPLLTVIVLCVLVTLADGYNISVSLNQALFGFGDAVCVPVIEWIATHYLNPVVSEFTHGYPLSHA